ncbi:hypothetical protein BSL78_05504 [Apostichopus japonicus]|uniref:Craniofacial development protein 2-like n=1 Tax=Stichopus japonicus TaxID=307972 RepID=A0A2G8LBF6_STIJA|nr:hypothetical protein BSL78_05504 [Apostichopus japonicus]
MIEPPTAGSERLLKLRVNTTTGPVNLVSAYAPTLASNPHAKDQLDKLIGQISQNEDLFLLGDFNARVGTNHQVWPTCLGHHGIGKLNEISQRLLELCCAKRLCITKTYFKHKDKHRVSWMHPRSKKWHQLDLVVARRNRIQDVNSTRSYHSADCDTDHSLVISKVILKPKRLHHSKPKGLSKINIAHTGDAERTQEFISLVSDIRPADPEESAESRWHHLSSTIHKSAIQAYGIKKKEY